DSRDSDGDDAMRMSVMYQGKDEQTGIEYIFNEQSGVYERYENQEQTVEFNSEIPIVIDNVFVVETSHEVIDEQERRAIDLDSGGNASLLQIGHVQSLEWTN